MLARETELSIETIRFYQRKGLLAKPSMLHGRVCRYGAKSIKCLNFVKSAKQLGFTLNEIIDLLKLEENVNCNEARIIAENKLKIIRERMVHLRHIKSHLEQIITSCCLNVMNDTCPLIDSLKSD